MRSTRQLFEYRKGSTDTPDGISIIAPTTPGVTGRLCLLADAYPISDSVKTICPIGDSTTQGTNSPSAGIVAGYRIGLWKQLSETQGDGIETVGDAVDSFAGIPSLGDWQHAGYSGYTIELIDAHLATLFGTLSAAPDVAIVSAGINNFVLSGDTAVTAEGKWTTMISDLKARMPSGRVLVWPPTLQPGSGATSGQITQCRAFSAWLPTVAQAQGFTFVPVTLSPGDLQLDGRHPNAWGGNAIACALREPVRRALGQQRGRHIPRTVQKRSARYYAKNVATAPDRLEIAGGAGSTITPGSGAYALAITVCPTDLSQTATLLNIASYGTYAASGPFFVVGAYGPRLAVFWGSNVAPFSTGTTEPWATSLLVNTFHRIVFMVKGTKAALYVNGQMVGYTVSQPAYNITDQATLYLGNNGTFGALPAYLGDLRIHRGTGVPTPGSAAALRAVGQDYWDQASLCPGCSAYYSFDNTLLAGVYGDPAATLNGASAFSNAVHASWEWQGAGP